MSRPKSFFAPGEWYHCYSRGIDKRKTFERRADYERFLQLLYLTNSTEKVHRSDLRTISHGDIFSIPRVGRLVDIGAYTLMPNHFHLLIYEVEEDGISLFMQRLMTAYTMYFNIRNERTGGLFTKPFHARHIGDDRYFQHVIDYIHINPGDLFEYAWREKGVRYPQKFIKQLSKYPYSSLPDFQGIERPERFILGDEVFSTYQRRSLEEIAKSALLYEELELGH